MRTYQIMWERHSLKYSFAKWVRDGSGGLHFITVRLKNPEQEKFSIPVSKSDSTITEVYNANRN